MNWVSFFSGITTVFITYALFSRVLEDEQEEIQVDKESGVVVNDLYGRYVTLSCQTCRKLKKHREVETNLFQCTKCKRHVDLR
ncbi:hypothetical protein [Bacillus sp. AFS031507]|uniref:hypothetical protein n=1 Tax=Bacillus sp. AFS031507 TaxID=2033496 RepID=UPI000BFC6DE0|nr:hypothetical protein [Bacillus sp. AFS031507]PGY11065.1 hypothetical protein COE25_15035 [Bacillus sp. AFS031507]